MAACVHAMMHSGSGGEAFSCAPQEMLVVGADGVETVMTRMACDAAVPRYRSRESHVFYLVHVAHQGKCDALTIFSWCLVCVYDS